MLFAEANYMKGAELKGDKLEIKFKFPIKKVKHFLIAKKGYTKHIYDIKGGVLPLNQKLLLKHKNVKSFRIGQYNKSTLRIVIETRKGQGNRHYINSKVLTIPLPKGKRVSTASKKKNSKKRKKTLKKRRKAVVIDAGHGGRDNGASLFGVYEKELTLKISYKVKKRLEKMGYKVYMTRKRDRYVSLLERTEYSNRRDVDIFVSIHVNASPKHKRHILQGIETFYLSAPNANVRKRRILHKGKTLYSNNIYRKMIGSKKRSYSKYLAKKVKKQVSRNIRRSYGPVKSKLKCSDFWVLIGTKVPSILVETGYLTHKKDRKRLTSNHYQNLIAKGIAEGINSYFYGGKNSS